MELTLGNLVDQLITVDIKMYHLEDVKRNPSATDSEIAEACKKTNVLNKQRHDLIQAIDEIVGTNKYNQGDNKMYGK